MCRLVAYETVTKKLRSSSGRQMDVYAVYAAVLITDQMCFVVEVGAWKGNPKTNQEPDDRYTQ